MKIDSLLKRTEWIKKPSVQLAFVLIVGFLFNVGLFFSKVQPDFLTQTLLSQNIKQLQDRRAAIAASPLPLKVEEAEIQKLILQVPTKFEISRVLIDLERLEEETGAKIIDLSVGEEKEEVKDELVAYIENALKKTPALNQTGTAAVPQPSASGASQASQADQSATMPTQANTNQPKLETPIQAENVALTVEGTYQQVTDYMGQLYEIDRIVNIRTWELAPTKNGLYAIKFGLTLFTAPKYANSFHDLPTISTHIETNAEHPVMTDEQFLETMKSQP